MYNFPVIHKQKEFFQSATRTSSKIKFKNYLTAMPKQAYYQDNTYSKLQLFLS